MHMQRTNYLVVWPVLALLLATSGGCARTEPGVEIPLSKIWAWEMLETKDVRNLEPNNFFLDGFQVEKRIELLKSSISHGILAAIDKQGQQKPIGPGFAIPGSDQDALLIAKAHLEQDKIPPHEFRSGSDLTLFFYTRKFDRYVRIKKVLVAGYNIAIQYHFVPHVTRDVSLHFALIPLVDVKAGNYQVKLVQLPMEEKHKSLNFKPLGIETREKYICQSFGFKVSSVGDSASIRNKNVKKSESTRNRHVHSASPNPGGSGHDFFRTNLVGYLL